MPNWEELKKEWETTKITLKDLAAKHNIKLGTLKSRKSREKWSRGATKKDATKPKKVATPKKKVATKNKEQFEPIVESDDLTEKQRLFCIYYIKYFNATKAYQKAYECAYSTAMVQGHRHLRNPKISAEIDRMKAEQANELKLDVRDILQKYIDIAFADIGDYVERDSAGFTVTVKPLEEMDTSVISELSNTENGIKLKLSDKMKALEMLSKYFDLLSENDKKRLQEEKTKAETEFTKERTKLIKGEKKDTSLLDALIEGRKQYEQNKH
ncbi:phage terminase small subunit [Lentibacillus populi]|uniref:Phage terminase small subunit n=1 Tax=Lentibacillus populi TaxID=1827502 RepID=A0A9W5TTP2_9BACI|nr:terminase small subunit [Lentibacillus populi]GGB26743.1 phage terminase small subunit [Lentibacillus populi]